MTINDGIIDKWAEEALQDLGAQGWRDIDPNSMMLIIYSMQRNRDKKLAQKITTPIWWVLAVVGAGLLWYIVGSIFGII